MAVASSISLPSRAVLTESPNLQTLAESPTSGSGGTSPTGHTVRRHSYDVLHRDKSEEFFDCTEGDRQGIASDGDVTASSSSEASPRHLPRGNRGAPYYDGFHRGGSGIPSPYVRRLSGIIGRARAANSTLGGAESRCGSSSRDSLESDLDDRGDIDSHVFSVNSDDASASLPGSPIIKVQRLCEQVGMRLAFIDTVSYKPQRK